MITRRSFLRTAAALTGLGTGICSYTFLVEPTWLEITHRQLPIPHLPPELAGTTLAHLSDLHVSPFVSDDYVLDTFREIAARRPDFLVITGDLMSWHPGWRDHVARIYRQAPRGRLATVATLGNHDYGAGWGDMKIADELTEIVSGCDITVLRNQALDAGGLQIAGFDDLWAKRFNANDVVQKLGVKRAAVALSHNPDTVDLPVWGNYQGWILSGHTHGGQCKPPFLPPPILPVQNRRYTSGEFQLAGNRRLYISRGVGQSLPARFNARPEVTIFELV
jgi:uncharacterized protein